MKNKTKNKVKKKNKSIEKGREKNKPKECLQKQSNREKIYNNVYCIHVGVNSFFLLSFIESITQESLLVLII